jgi:hypothetical protein
VALKRSRPAQPRHHGKAAPAKRRWVRPGMMAYGFELGRAAGSAASAGTWTAPTVARAPNQSAIIRMSPGLWSPASPTDVNQIGGRSVDLFTGEHGGAMHTDSGPHHGRRPHGGGWVARSVARAAPQGQTVRTGR